jgi:hypothetical protein
MHWLKSNRWLDFQEDYILDTSWLQKLILKEKYANKNQNQSYKNQVKKNHSPVKIHFVKNANSNLISFMPKKITIRKIKEAEKVRQRIK